MIEIFFEHDFQQKIMSMAFAEGSTLATTEDVMRWRAKWTAELKSWHSPYKAFIDLKNLKIEDDEQVFKNLGVMFKFFEGLFLKKAVAYHLNDTTVQDRLPFEVASDFDTASTAIGVRLARTAGPAKDFRSTIQFQNHFPQHTIELSFTEPVAIDSKEKLAILKSKLMNNLMQWHSKWSLLVDCTNLDISNTMNDDFKNMTKFFNSLFMKTVIGYGAKKEDFPFEVFRARHKAVAQLEAEGYFSGDKAQCKTR